MSNAAVITATITDRTKPRSSVSTSKTLSSHGTNQHGSGCMYPHWGRWKPVRSLKMSKR